MPAVTSRSNFVERSLHDFFIPGLGRDFEIQRYHGAIAHWIRNGFCMLTKILTNFSKHVDGGFVGTTLLLFYSRGLLYYIAQSVEKLI